LSQSFLKDATAQLPVNVEQQFRVGYGHTAVNSPKLTREFSEANGYLNKIDGWEFAYDEVQKITMVRFILNASSLSDVESEVLASC
jgi:hypothetical protein